MRRRRGGFTLAEALVTLALVGTVLAVVAGLSTELSDVLRWSSSRDTAIFGPEEAVERVRGELSSAVAVIDPVDDDTVPSSQLIFDRVDPTSPSRLAPSPEPVRWDPLDARYLIRVRYYVAGGVLLRETTFQGGTRSVDAMAEGISGFSVRSAGAGWWHISASFLDERRVRAVSSYAHQDAAL